MKLVKMSLAAIVAAGFVTSCFPAPLHMQYVPWKRGGFASKSLV